MTRVRDIQRRFLQRQGWTTNFDRRSGTWVWRNRKNFPGVNFSREIAFREARRLSRSSAATR